MLESAQKVTKKVLGLEPDLNNDKLVFSVNDIVPFSLNYQTKRSVLKVTGMFF